jgi:hypothetical protein
MTPTQMNLWQWKPRPLVEVAADAVLLTAVVLAAGAAVEVGFVGFELGLGLELALGVVTNPFTVAQYRA